MTLSESSGDVGVEHKCQQFHISSEACTALWQKLECSKVLRLVDEQSVLDVSDTILYLLT